ncbi:hypothetical protein N9937_02415, partial [bacterium]|nr:hypothetical protein [bacterium]
LNRCVMCGGVAKVFKVEEEAVWYVCCEMDTNHHSALDEARHVAESEWNLSNPNEPTVRDLLAMASLTGQTAGLKHNLSSETLARKAYKDADAMLKTRRQGRI